MLFPFSISLSHGMTVSQLIFFSHAGEHLVCFQSGAITNSAAINILTYVFLWDVNPGVGLLGHGVCGSSAGAAKEFSGVIVSSPTTVYDGSRLLHIILSVPTPF